MGGDLVRKQCGALCRYGEPCLNYAEEPSQYCWLHNKLILGGDMG